MYFKCTNFGGRSKKQTVKVLLNYVLSRAAVFAANALASMPSPAIGETRSVAEYCEARLILSQRGNLAEAPLSQGCFPADPHVKTKTASPRDDILEVTIHYLFTNKLHNATLHYDAFNLEGWRSGVGWEHIHKFRELWRTFNWHTHLRLT